MSRAGWLSIWARRLACAALIVATLPPAAAMAAEERTQLLTLDSERSHADFEVKLLWLVGVHGRFEHVHGIIAIDRLRDSVMVDARIDTNAVSMRNRSHETWVKSAEFFDAQHYPEIQFVSDSIPLRRLQSGGEIEGLLTIRGISRRVRFELAAPTCPAAAGENCPVEAVGSIRRSEFGMQSRRGALSDRVDLSFSIYTVPQASDPNQ